MLDRTGLFHHKFYMGKLMAEPFQTALEV